MRASSGRLINFALGVSLTLGAASTRADDTEIFFNVDNQTSIRPNLLFILDNSGSMATKVEVEVPVDPVYNPDKDYSGSWDQDDVYFQHWGNWYRISENNLSCSDMNDRIHDTGSMLSYRMAYRTRSWRSWKSMDSNYRSHYEVDCEADDDVNYNWGGAKLFDYYSGNYLNWQNSTPTTVWKTRLEIMQEVANNLADSMTGVNLGLMAFNVDNTTEGGRVLNPVTDVATNRDNFKAAVNNLGADTWTPLSETLFGAMRYYGGGHPFLDNRPVSTTVDSNGRYDSPIELECQSNNIVLLTDGEPTKDTNHNGTIGSGIGKSCSGNCLDEIAGHMKTSDISAAFGGTQTVTTYTVGFQLNDPLLAATATAGGGDYYQANSADELAEAFKQILRSVLETSSTFVAPAVAVNTFTQMTHLDTLYYSVFEPDTHPLWQGNLKRYKIGPTGVILDRNNNPAIDATTGFFKESAVSWWTPTGQVDGPSVTASGARNQLPDDVDKRNVYSWLGGKDLTASANQIAPSNTSNITKSMLGDANMSDQDQLDLINWVRGVDVRDENGNGSKTDARKFIADPLHSRPQLIIYGGTQQEPETAVFFGDNQGFIHSINGKTGESNFAFMPSELFGLQKTLMDNNETVGDRPYGMDGTIVTWTDNETGAVSASDGDHVYLYSGMRRGGRNYYALDVTKLDQPKALWKILGGQGSFSELGQSWSEPVKTKLKVGGTVHDVLIFGGGYDPDQDDATVRTEDDMGRALYVVDAETGQLLWWAGPTGSLADLALGDMNYSIPASPKVVDLTGDGLANQIYVGDMGGQVWRFDISNGKSASDLVTGGVIADLAGSDEKSARRFYHTPDVSVMNYWGKRYLAVVIGSGYQAHPLNKVIEDRTYMVRTPLAMGGPVDPGTGSVSYQKITEADLFDVTSNIIGRGSDSERQAAEVELSSKHGWLLRLEAVGEKMLSTAITVDGVTYFNTYEPATSLSACEPSVGNARMYSVLIRDGRPSSDLDGDPDDRVEGGKEPSPGLPGDPFKIRPGDKPLICEGAGSDCEPVPTPDAIRQTFWNEN